MTATATQPKYRVYEPFVAANQRAYVLDAIDRNKLTYRGEYVGRLERELGDYLNVRNVIATCNGSVSLFAIYKHVFDARRGPVVVPSVTYAATVSQLILAGFRPLYIDCDEGFRANLNQLEWVLAHHPVAGVVIPELYADGPDLNRVTELCDRAGVPFVEDAAEALGCFDSSRRALGTFGRAGSFSFFANKIITTGEGGAIVTNDDGLADRLRSFCNQNHTWGYRHSAPGTNFRMTNLQAAIGCAQLEQIDEIIERKKAIAEHYRASLLFKPVIPSAEESSEWMPVFELPGEEYESFRFHCQLNGVETRPAFPPVHLMPGFAGLTPLPLLESESIGQRHFILPCYPSLTDEDLSRIVSVANSYEVS